MYINIIFINNRLTIDKLNINRVQENKSICLCENPNINLNKWNEKKVNKTPSLLHNNNNNNNNNEDNYAQTFKQTQYLTNVWLIIIYSSKFKASL